MAENSEKLGKESEKSLNNEFEAIISEIDRIGLQEIQIPSSGSNIILASDNESILYSNDFGISVCNKNSLEVVKSLKLIEARVISFAYSELKSLFYLGDIKGTLYVYSSSKFKEALKIKLHTKRINKIILSFDELLLYSCSDDSDVKVFDLSSFDAKVLYSHDTASVKTFEISPDGENIASICNNSIKIYSIMQEKILSCLDAKEKIFTSVKFSSNGNEIVVGQSNGMVTIMNIYNWQTTDCIGHNSSIIKTWFSTNFVISASEKTIKIQNILKSSKAVIIPSAYEILDMVLDNENIYTISSNSLSFIKIPSINQDLLLKSHIKLITQIVFSSKKKLVFTVSEEKKVSVWNASNFELFKELDHDSHILTICLSADQKNLYVSLESKVIKRWNIEDFEYEIFSISEYTTKALVCSADNNLLIKLESSCKCVIKKLNGDLNEWSFGFYKLSYNCGLSWLSNILVLAGDKIVHIYSLELQKFLGKIENFDGEITKIKVSKDDRLIGICTKIGKVYICSIEKLACIKEIFRIQESANDIFFTEDNKFFIVLASDSKSSELYFFALNGFVLLTSIVFHKQCLAFTLICDEKYIAIGEEGSLCIRENPLKADNFVIEGPEDVYPVEYFKYIKSLSNSQGYPYNPQMDKFLILPSLMNSTHFYAFYNHTDYLQKSLANNAAIFASKNFLDIMSISLSNGYTNNVKIILKHLITTLSINPYAAFFIENSILKLNSQPCKELSLFYDAVFFKSQDILLPKFSDPVEMLHKSKFFEIQPNLMVNPKKTGSPIVFYQTGIKIDTELGSIGSISYMKTLISAKNEEILRTRLVFTIISDKWLQIRWFSQFLAIFYTTYLITLSLYTLENSSTYLAILITENIILILFQIYKIFQVKLNYFKDLWNQIDLWRALLTTTYFLLENKPIELLFIVHFFSWAKGLEYFRVFASTRYMISLLKQIVTESFSYLIILLYFTIAFGFLLLSLEEPSYQNFYEIWEVYLLDIGYFSLKNSFLYKAGFTFASIVNFLIMANLLISIIGDAHEKFKSFSDISNAKELAKMILEIEELMFWKRSASEKKFFHLVCCECQESFEYSWQGKVKELNTKIKDLDENLKKQHFDIAQNLFEIQNGISFIKAKLDKDIQTN